MHPEKKSTKDQPDGTDSFRAVAPSPSTEQRKAYAKAGKEILEKNMDPACWAMAIDHADGDQELARSYYARWRAEELSTDINDTESKKEDLDSRRVSSFNRIRQTPKPKTIPAALQPTYGALYWETLITVGLMCSFVPLVLRFTALQPTQALLYTLCASVSIVVALRISARIIFQNKAGQAYRRLAATAACLMAITSLLVGGAILKSGWDQEDYHNTDIQVVPEENSNESTTSTQEQEIEEDERQLVISD